MRKNKYLSPHRTTGKLCSVVATCKEHQQHNVNYIKCTNCKQLYKSTQAKPNLPWVKLANMQQKQAYYFLRLFLWPLFWGKTYFFYANHSKLTFREWLYQEYYPQSTPPHLTQCCLFSVYVNWYVYNQRLPTQDVPTQSPTVQKLSTSPWPPIEFIHLLGLLHQTWYILVLDTACLLLQHTDLTQPNPMTCAQL